MKPMISLIAAVSDNRVIGNNGEIPWKIPGEQKRFKEITVPHPLIMGRKTFESIGRILPDRPNIIVTRDITFHVDGAIVCHSIDEAIKIATELDHEEIFIIGGGNIFEKTITIADRLYLTIVHIQILGDAFFPEYQAFTKEISREEKQQDEYLYTYVTLERKDE